MKKIISLFQRNYDGDRLVRNELVPGAEWVASGEGVATRKYDGTSCMVSNGVLYKRYDVRGSAAAPDGFIPAQDADKVTGHWPGWVLVGDCPEDKWHREAADVAGKTLDDGTYELIGPKIQGNPEGRPSHTLIAHGCDVINAPRTFDELKAWFSTQNIEGVVWHHPDGRMVKIKKKDFGLRRKS
jgi:hypothetical protein